MHSELLGPVTGAMEKKFNNQPSCLPNRTSPSFFSSTSSLFYLSSRLFVHPPPLSLFYHQSTHHSVRRRSFHLALFNATPFLAIHHVASLLHYITHRPREKPPHALFVAVTERFPLQKWRLKKQKSNFKNMLCSHQWGDLLFGHNATSTNFGMPYTTHYDWEPTTWIF